MYFSVQVSLQTQPKDWEQDREGDPEKGMQHRLRAFNYYTWLL